ncbi:MAG TPA: NYN domain-containing protein [Ignavibacteriaceae bacterium]|nr:NYN domain-containing protein [Ignavibacteriaceae bacterium]
MKEVIIDGNNLIGKIKALSILQKKDKIAAREKLAFILDRFYSNKAVKVCLHFDGYKNISIKIEKIRIIYSNEKTADEKIKAQIEEAKNRKNISVVTSDRNLQEFAKVCSCGIISSEDFAKTIRRKIDRDDEQIRIDEINNIEEFKKIFNTK